MEFFPEAARLSFAITPSFFFGQRAGRSRMILIEGCVDLKDETYRLSLTGLTPRRALGLERWA